MIHSQSECHFSEKKKCMTAIVSSLVEPKVLIIFKFKLTVHSNSFFFIFFLRSDFQQSVPKLQAKLPSYIYIVISRCEKPHNRNGSETSVAAPAPSSSCSITLLLRIAQVKRELAFVMYTSHIRYNLCRNNNIALSRAYV